MAQYQFTKHVLYLDDLNNKIVTSTDYGSNYQYCTLNVNTLTLYFAMELTTDQYNNLVTFITTYENPTNYLILAENLSFSACSPMLDIYNVSTTSWTTIFPFIYSSRVTSLRAIKIIVETKMASVGTPYSLRLYDRNKSRVLTSINTTVPSTSFPVITLTIDPSIVPSYDSVFLFEARSSTLGVMLMIHCFQLLFYYS